jgi:hypothetical protein
MTMAPRVPKSLLRAIALAGVPVCLILVASCAEDAPTSVDRSDVGVLEGRVTEAGLPVPARISFESASGAEPEVRISVYADSTGWYRVELPLGLYRRSFRLGDQSAMCCGDRDTVLVGRAVRRRDFARGRARITIALPPAYEDRSAWLNLASSEQAASYWTSIADGAAHYDLRMMPPDGYTMRVSFDYRMVYVYVPSDDDPARADTLRVGADAVTDRTIDFRDRHASISGRVHCGTAQLSSDLRVEVRDVYGASRGSVTCGSDGSYRVDLILPEPVRLRSTHGPISRWFGGDAIGDATVYDLQPGDALTGIDQAAGVLRARFDGPGDLVENAAVVLLRDENGTETVFTNTPQNPLVIGNLKPGRFQLFVAGGCVGQPWKPQWYEGSGSVEGATFLDIVDGQVTDVAMTLVAGGAITGTLAYTGDPWGMTIGLRDVDGGRICPTTVTIRDSLFELPGLPDGDYRLALYLGSSPWWYPGTWSLDESAIVSVVDGGTVSGLVWPLPFPYGKAAP